MEKRKLTCTSHTQMCVCECLWTESEHNKDGFGLFIKHSIILFNLFILFPHNRRLWGYTDWTLLQKDILALLFMTLHAFCDLTAMLDIKELNRTFKLKLRSCHDCKMSILGQYTERTLKSPFLLIKSHFCRHLQLFQGIVSTPPAWSGSTLESYAKTNSHFHLLYNITLPFTHH